MAGVARLAAWSIRRTAARAHPAGAAARTGPPAGPELPARSGDELTGRRRRGWKRGLLLGGVIAFIAACAIAMLVILGYSIGLNALIIGFVAAILPVPVLVACFLWLDRYEPEPVPVPDLLLRLGRVRRHAGLAGRQQRRGRRSSSGGACRTRWWRCWWRRSSRS